MVTTAPSTKSLRTDFVNFRVPPEFRERLRLAAESRGVSMTTFMIRAVEAAIAPQAPEQK